MTTAQAERAINQLYESESLRTELRDEEASLLLMWGEARLRELANRDLPDSQFDQVCEKFRSMLAAINVCVGKRKTSPSQHLPMMASISSAAEASGYKLTPDDQTLFLKEQGALTNQDAISELLGLLKPAEIPSPSSPSVDQAAEIITPPVVIESAQPPAEDVGEAKSEIITPQAAPEIVNNSLPPQPEELPEHPQPPPPQEG